MISFADVDYVVVAIATVYSFALGMLWYGPLFGKKWMELSKVQPPKKGDSMVGTMVIGLLNTFVTALFTYVFVILANARDWMDGLLIGLYISIGFAATILLSDVLWEKKPFNLYLLNTAYRVVSFVGMGILIAAA